MVVIGIIGVTAVLGVALAGGGRGMNFTAREVERANRRGRVRRR